MLQGKGREHHYAVDSYFGEHRYSLFGKDATEQQQKPAEHKRLLAEDEAALAFPLRASGRAAFKQLALLHRQVRAPFFVRCSYLFPSFQGSLITNCAGVHLHLLVLRLYCLNGDAAIGDMHGIVSCVQMQLAIRQCNIALCTRLMMSSADSVWCCQISIWSRVLSDPVCTI